MPPLDPKMAPLPVRHSQLPIGSHRTPKSEGTVLFSAYAELPRDTRPATVEDGSSSRLGEAGIWQDNLPRAFWNSEAERATYASPDTQVITKAVVAI